MSKLKPTQTGQTLFSSLMVPYTSPAPVTLGTPMHNTSRLGQAQPAHSRTAEDGSQRGSARRKLWDLSNSAACPVTGVCMRLPDLYKLARKAGLPVQGCSEYEVHIKVVSECRRRSDMAERVQRELDSRYELYVKKSVQMLKTTEDLARWWDKACVGMDWAGVFWAVLTHPRCTPELEAIVLGQVHMLQHQVGMAARVDHTKLHEVLDENLRLGEELELTQQRLQSARQTHAQELGRAQAQWHQLKANEPDLPTRQALADENAHLLAHNRLLRRALDKAESAQTRTPATALPASACGDDRCGNDAPGHRALVACDHPLQLADRAVLCVGGRTGGVPAYREVIEQQRTRFLHHDGGEEERSTQLGHHLQAADVVICQVACISHNAYWRVKEHCKRTGKPCLFVESSSRSALERALGQAVTSQPLPSSAA
jgi:hypothetical protein